MATCPSMIVPEVLSKENYKRWNILMRHYLVAQGLWDVVESNEMPVQIEWVKKNALALHSIKISCGTEMFNRIQEMDSAKDAWDALAEMHRPPSYHDVAELQEVFSQDVDALQEETGQQKTLHDWIRRGNIGKVKQFLRDNPDSRSESILDSAIHVAITAGKKDIARYLYKETPLRCLHGDRGFLLLQECIKKKMFDIAFDLLHLIPELALKNPSGSTPLILMLAQSPSLLEGRLFGSLSLWIYNYIRVKLYPIKPRGTPANGEDQQTRGKSIISVFNSFRSNPRKLSEALETLFSLSLGFTPVALYFLHQYLPQSDGWDGPAILFCFMGLLVATLRRHQWPTLTGMLVFPFVAGHKLNLVGQLIAGFLLSLCIGSLYWKDQGIFIVETLFFLGIFLVAIVRSPVMDLVPIILGQPLLYLVALRRQNRLCMMISGMPFLLFVTFSKMDLIGALAQLLLSVLVGLTLAKDNGLWLLLMVELYVAALYTSFLCTLTLSNSGPSDTSSTRRGISMTILELLSGVFSVPLLYYIWLVHYQKLTDEYVCKVIHLICHQLSNLNQNQFVQSKAVEAAFEAIKNDNPDIVIEITKANENILWSSTDPEESTSLFACAVANRQEKVAQFLHELGASTDRNIINIIDEDGNNVLHIAAKLAPHSKLSHNSGAALQLQSELRWFKSVAAIVPRSYKEQKNNAGETPSQVFTREHEDLLKKAEEWMKKTAESSTVVGALILTIMFAVAFTVPGGNDQNTGLPVLLNSTRESSTVVPFTVFIVSDAISLFAASAAVLMFFVILTSRYTYQNFLISLPLKFFFGLCSLFISIATMAVAFCASLFIMLEGRLVVFIPITLLAGIPVILFMLGQSQLVFEIYSSTCRSRIFGQSFATTLGNYVRSRLFISRLFIRRPTDN